MNIPPGIRGTLLIGFAFLAASLAGCASTHSTRAKPLDLHGRPLDLRPYSSATVVPFIVDTANPVDPSLGARFADDIATRLRYDFGPLFSEVRRADVASGRNDEVIVTGSIHKYRAGSKVGRVMFGAFGASVLEGDLVIKNGASNDALLSVPFDKLWAWHGPLGASKGIDDMRAEMAAAIANTVARAKGWTPQSPPP